MDRREFVSGVALGLLAAPLTAEAQPERNVPKIGLIMLSAPGTEWRPAASGPFWERLRELGWVEGQNIVVERRGAGGDWDRIPSLAGELAQLKVAVILVGTGAEARRTQQGTRTVPICAAAGDLQAEGLVANLAKPEGNVTGVQVVQADLVGKRLSLLKDAVPGLTRVGVLIGGRSPTTIAVLRNAEEAGRRMGLELHVVEGRSPQDFERVFSVLTKEHASGLLVMHSPATSTNVGQIVALNSPS
jgi:putative ABC transport system substrate-binding protein